MNVCVLMALLLAQVVPEDEAAEVAAELVLPTQTYWFIFYIVVMVTAAMVGILFLIVILGIKLSRISKQLDEISDSAATFIRTGLDHFKERTGKRTGKHS